MTLIKSISGIRGTIGGKPGEGLSPFDILKFAVAYGQWIKLNNKEVDKPKIVLGRDARISGEMVDNIISGGLTGIGIDIVNIGMATTPTVEMAVTDLSATGGIIITASHNPAQWNALKLLNSNGEFLSSTDGEEVLNIADEIDNIVYSEVDKLGVISQDNTQLEKHIKAILDLPYVDVEIIKNADLQVAFDSVNSVGGIAIPKLLEALGVERVIPLYNEPNGKFPHNPEPLAENLTEISKVVVDSGADMAFVVDPDVDRLAIVCEDGSMFGEEYTLVACSDHILQYKKGNTVSNLSSTRALRDVTERAGGEYFASAVGEVNVVTKMKSENAVIGGEGNGGVILPELHYGRDALLGIALFLTLYVKKGIKCTKLRRKYPDYFMSKKKIELSPQVDLDSILLKVENKYKEGDLSNIDGVKINFESSWVHIRKSNTEPIVRIYTEATSQEDADRLANSFIIEIKSLIE